MGPWVAIGFVAFMVSSLVIGIRLLLLWRRTRRLPELLIACGILGIGPVAFTFILGATSSGETLPWLATACFAGALLSTSAGAFATAIFNWRVFHPDAPALRLLVGALALGFVGAFFWEAITTGFADPAVDAAGVRMYSVLSTTILLWGAAESLRYFAMMRRRRKLGLADPLVTHRFLLWGLGIGAAGVGSAISVTAQAITGEYMLAVPWIMVSNSLHGLTAAVLMWVAFIPPGFYRRMVESRSQQLAA
jgi:hypothetical protein